MSEGDVLCGNEEGTATITLDRPEKMNAVSDHMLGDLANLLNEVVVDDSVRARLCGS